MPKTEFKKTTKHRTGAGQITMALGIALGGYWAAPAYADVYKFTDENNVVHFHNIPNHPDPRFKVFLREQPFTKPGSQFTHPNRKHFAPIISKMAQRYNIDEELLHAIIRTESSYNPNAVSPKGAVGLMQLMPGTAGRYGVADSYDPIENIRGGTQYLRDLLEMFDNNLKLAVAAYNCGENAVIRYGHKIPPYNETINYVAKVFDLYQPATAQN